MTDYAAILEDDSINCVIELIGGVTTAKDVSVPPWKGCVCGRCTRKEMMIAHLVLTFGTCARSQIVQNAVSSKKTCDRY